MALSLMPSLMSGAGGVKTSNARGRNLLVNPGSRGSSFGSFLAQPKVRPPTGTPGQVGTMPQPMLPAPAPGTIKPPFPGLPGVVGGMVGAAQPPNAVAGGGLRPGMVSALGTPQTGMPMQPTIAPQIPGNPYRKLGGP